MSKSNKIKIILSIVAISFIQGMQFSVSPILGQIQQHYSDVDVSLIQMLITAPALLAMIIALVSGWLVTKISKKKMLVFAGFVAGVTGFLPFLADSFLLLFISRTMYGVALGLACTLNTAVVAEFFEGDERVTVMGIQAASIGGGMVLLTTLGGRLGSLGFEKAYYTNIVGIISMIVLALCLPDTGVAKVTNTEKIQLNRRVFELSILCGLEFLFLITFTTNIAMHLRGTLAGNTSISGNLTGIFSASQIVIGLVLGLITKITKRMTLPVAMMSFVIGAILLILYPDQYVILIIAAIFCGFSQGIFVPIAMVEVSNAVTPVSTAMACACFTCFMSLGQFLSPIILNGLSSIIFGSVSTSDVYVISVIGMMVAAILALFINQRQNSTKKNTTR